MAAAAHLVSMAFSTKLLVVILFEQLYDLVQSALRIANTLNPSSAPSGHQSSGIGNTKFGCNALRLGTLDGAIPDIREEGDLEKQVRELKLRRHNHPQEFV